jgi:hypothetical protein
VRRDLGTCKTGTSVESDTITTSTAIDLDLSCVWLEVRRSIFGSDTTLNCEPTPGDRVLRQTELRKSRTSCDLDLGGDDVKPGNFLYYRIGKRIYSVYGKEVACNSMFDLDARIDLDKVVSSLLINQEFCGSCIPIIDALRELDRISPYHLADLLREMRCRRDLDHFLMPALNRTIALK